MVSEVAGLVGLPEDVSIRVQIDETSPFGRTSSAVSGRAVVISAESGAFEDAKHFRHFADTGSRLVLGRLLFRVADRLDPAFGSPPPDPDLTLAHHAAWDAYAVGRYARLAGVDGGRDRRRYAFRLRHGFSDIADRLFDELWYGEGLSWADIDRVCAEALTGGRGR